VKVSRGYLRTTRLLMYLGDNLIRQGITALVDEFNRERPNCMILLAEVPNPSEFGVAELKDGRVARLEEKPRNRPAISPSWACTCSTPSV